MAYCTGMPSPRIGFVTCLTWPDISESDRHVQRALEARGITVMGVPWNAPEQRLGGVDLAGFCSSWDYHHAPQALLARPSEGGSRRRALWNPPDPGRWNPTQRY